MKLVRLLFVAGAFVALTATPAFAHHPALTATTACTDGTHEIQALLTNGAKKPMTVTRFDATVGESTYRVAGYANPVEPEGETGAIAEIPGSVTGTVTLTADLTWPDGFTKTVTAPVELEQACTVTTTSVPETTTTTRPPTSSSTAPPTSSPPTTQCDPTVPPCAYTGSSSAPVALLGLAAVLSGAGILAATRRRRGA